jgi:mono/diheme cytochrome c family protein
MALDLDWVGRGGMETMKRLFFVGLLAVSPLLAASAGSGQAPAAKKDANEPEDPYEIPEAARGRRNPLVRSDLALRDAQALWQKHCETCHGATGRGDGPNARLHEQRKGHAPRNLTNPKVQANLTDGDIFWRITKGIIEEGNNVIMPRYEDKIPSENDRWQLVLFVRELAQPAAR